MARPGVARRKGAALRPNRLTIPAALALSLAAVRPGGARAEDAPAAPAPAPDPEQAAALERAAALTAKVNELAGSGTHFVEATPLARESLAIRTKALGPNHLLVAESLNDVAILLYYQRGYAEARPLFERALAIREKVLGRDDLHVAEIVSSLGQVLKAQGAFREARPLLERVLAIHEKLLGRGHPDVATDLGSLAMLLQAQGASAEATPFARESLAIREKALGPDQPLVAESLGRLASLLKDQGAYQEARPLFERALAIDERALGPDHLYVALDLYGLAEFLRAQASYAEARPLHERALAIREATLGKDHPDVAQSLVGLASLGKDQGSYAVARPLLERALGIYEGALGKDSPEVAATLGDLASVLFSQGAYAEARPLFERGLASYERAFGNDHPLVATSLNNLATLLHAQGAYAEARPLFERALAINEKALGRDHPQVATSLDNLAEVLRAQGAHAEARRLYERALAIHEKALGKDHPGVATDLGNLAALLKDEGAYAEARPLYQRALAIDEKALGRDHPDVGRDVGNLATLLHAQGEYAQARPLYERALAIQEKALGKDHPEVGATLGNLAELLRAQKAYAEARPYCERALAIDERALGRDHPAVATNLISLASLLSAQGAFQEARPLFERALAIDENAFGKDHPEVAESLGYLGLLLVAQGADREARPLFERELRMTESHVRAQLSALNGQQRLGLLRSTRHRLDIWVRFAPRVGLSGYREALHLRGLVSRAEAAERVLSRRASGDDRQAQQALRGAQGRAAKLANDVPTSFATEARAAWQSAYAGASAERERLTLELTERMAPLRVALERLDLGVADVQAHLGADTALVDYLRVGDRYFAWIVRATGEPVRVDVGAAEAVEMECAAFVRAMADGLDASATGTSLRSLVWAPVLAKLGEGVKRLVICPDAALAAVPFAALPDARAGRSVLDDVPITYVMNAQDLVPSKDAPPLGAGALLVGGVDYERASAGAISQGAAEPALAHAPSDRAPRGGAFSPIPQTRIEVESLRDRLGRVSSTLLLGGEATESRLREAVRGKRFVHIATHGFAREDLLAGLYTRKIAEAWTSEGTERQLAAGYDPMLLSGLAMAGANPREGGRGEDGILTALEASYLDLDGVDLVTLSACETARGTAESGEGVQGLVSAFQMAGARRVLASLWRVDDEGTRRLMEGFYDRMLREVNPLAPADALREAALALRDSKDASGRARFAAPRYWAAFVLYERG